MALLLITLAILTILLGGPIALGALSRGYLKLGLSLAAGVVVSAVLLFPPSWLEPVMRTVWSALI